MTAARVPGYALWRLFWRPAAIAFAFPLFFALMIPYAEEESAQARLNIYDMMSAAGSVPARLNGWLVCVTLPCALGIVIGLVTREATHTNVGWMLPSYQRRLTAPTIAVAVLSACGLAIHIANLTSAPAGVAAFAIALLAFAIGWSTFDAIASKLLRLLGALLVVAVVTYPSFLMVAAERYSLALAVFSLASSAFIFAGLQSRALLRQRAFKPASFSSGRSPAFTEGEGTWPSDVVVSASSRLGLIRAGLYESFGGRRFGRSGDLIWSLVAFGGMASLMRTSSMIIMAPMASMSTVGTQLKNSFAYPISRRRRADMFFIASLIDNVVSCSLTALVIITLMVSGLWRVQKADTTRGAIETLGVVLMFALFAPLLQCVMVPGWSFTQKNIPSARKVIVSVVFLVYMMLAIGAEVVLFSKWGVTPSRSPAFYAIAFVAIQLLFWGYLRRYFAKKDLP